jgi:integrase
MVVKRSGVTVRLFALSRKHCSSYTIAYYLAGERQRETFRGTLDLAKARAAEIAEQISAQNAGHGVLPLRDVRAYQSAVEKLAPLGVALSDAVDEYVDARRRIGNRPLKDAADFYTRHVKPDAPQKSLAEVAQEMLDTKKKRGKSMVYLRGLRRCLEPACDVLTGPISQIQPKDIDDYLLDLDLGSRTIKNVRSALVTTFAFAKNRGYLPDDRETAASRSEPIEVKANGPVEIFTPKEMEALLTAADSDTLPMIALGGFAGLRTAEIGRLEWKDVSLEQAIITISADNSKTASRRVVPIQSNLAQWLAPYAKETGFVFKKAHLEEESRWSRMAECQDKTAQTAGVKWKRNGLRHSYCSYRLSQTKNAAEVALEMGNSPTMVFSNYRELVTPRDTAAWWAISPRRADNVIPMQAKAGDAGE